MMKPRILLLLFFTIPITNAVAQETDQCVQNIEIAQQRFDEGRIQDIQPLLNNCVKNGSYNDAQKTAALRLLTLSYIFLEEEKNAEASMLLLLETSHEFEVNPAIDPTEFINLHERFRYKPLFNVGGRYITNFAVPIVSGLNSTLNLNDGTPVYTTEFGAIGFGLNFEYEFKENFFIYPEIHFKIMSISKSFSQPGEIDNGEFLTIDNYENQSWLSFPISVKYVFNFKKIPKFKLYANLGGSIDLLVQAKKPSDKSGLNQVSAPFVGFNLQTQPDKNNLNFGILAGGGATYKLGEGFLSIEARYLYSLTNVTNPDNVLNPINPDQRNTGAQDDIYKLNHVAISLGYTLNIYMPKLLR